MSLITSPSSSALCASRKPVGRILNLRNVALRGSRGFSLIEVLIALVVLALGLLGLAFLQVLNVRYTQSAQHRTMATNLASEMLDMMRANSVAAKQYGYITESDFNITVPTTGCARTDEATYQANIARWKCEVVSSLPGGKGAVAFNGNEVTVSLAWSDDIGRNDGGDVGKPAKTTKFEVKTRL